MMELTCVVVLTLTGLVAATPHGYGVKGGASSGAVAGASASSFGGSTGSGYPSPVQLGPGYSGSFSKSYSSSSSSSSASSSSSSSAFSFSGTSAGGLPGFGTDGKSGGCGSGNCQAGGAHGSSATHGSNDIGAGLQAYNSANAVSTAGAGANSLANGGCASGSCLLGGDRGSSAGLNAVGSGVQSYNTVNAAATSGAGANTLANGSCASESCQTSGAHGSSATNSNDIDTSLQAHHAANAASTAGAGAHSGSGCQGSNCNIDTAKCTSGQCKQHPYSSVDSDSINKCISGNCGTEQSGPSNDILTTDTTGNDQPSKFDKESTGYSGAGSDCSTGDCGPLATASTDKNKPSSDGDIYAGYQKPSTHLETPHLGPACSSGNCGATGTNADQRPSSYNVPIHGTYSTVPKPSCSGGNCDNYQTSKGPTGYFNPQPDSTNVNSPSSGHSPTIETDSIKCVGQSCNVPPNQGTPGHFGIKPGSNYAPSGLSSSGDKLPTYTSPSGILKPNVGNAPALSSEPHLFTPSYIIPAVGNAPSGCNTPNCAGYPSTGTVSGLITPSISFGTTHPTGIVQPSNTASIHTQHNEKLPAYTGGFGGPAGVLKPNELNTVTGKPSHTYSGSTPSYNTGSTSCNTPNCSGYPSNSAAAPGAHAHVGTISVTKPSTGATNENLPSYTGGFGGPAGVLKPSGEHGRPSSPGYTYSGTPSYNVPSGSSISPGCKSPTCTGSPISGAAAGANADVGSFTITKPSSGLSPDSQKHPSYTGGFGGPSEGLKPHASNVPSVTPIHSGSQSFDTPSTGASGCNTPNCGYPAGTSSHKPGYSAGEHIPDVHTTVPNNPTYAVPSTPSKHGSTGIGSPSSCSTPNCAGSATSSAIAGANAEAGSVSFNKPGIGESGKLPTYTGGLGGSAGTLKPNEVGLTGTHGSPGFTHSIGSPSHNVPNCKTSNCGSYPSAGAGAVSGAHAQTGSFGGIKPIDSDEELPPYKGGFGGPSGILKPNEYSVPAVGLSPSVYYKPLSSLDTPKPASCSSGACAHTSSPHAHSTTSLGVQATAGATAAAEEVEYTGGFNGPPGVLKPYESDKAGTLSTIGKQTVRTHYSPSGSLSNDASGGAVGYHSTTSQAAALGQATGQGGYVNHGGLSHAGADGVGHSGAVGPGYAGAGIQGNGLGLAGASVLGQAGSVSQSSGYGHAGATGLGYTGANGIGHEGGPSHAQTQAGATGVGNEVTRAGSVAHAGAVSSTNSGSIGGYNGPHSTNGGSGCGGGCSGSNSGSSSFGYSGDLSKLGYLDGLRGSLSSSGASAKSLSSSTAFGSSFASAHATAGAGVKGGYGKR